MKENICKIRMGLRKNAWSLLIFITGYSLGYLMFGVLCIRQVISLALRIIGYSNLTEENYGAFLCHPVSLILFLVTGLLLLFLFLAELAGIINCYGYSWAGEKICVSEMFWLGAKQAVGYVRRSPVGWIILTLGTIPVLEMCFLIREASYVKMIQYTASMLYKRMPSASFWVGAGLLIIVMSYWAVLSLPYSLLDGESCLEGMRKGRAAGRKLGILAFLGMLVMEVLTALLIFVIYAMVMALLVLGICVTQVKEQQMARLIVYSDQAAIGSGIVAGIVGTVLLAALLFLYYMAAEDANKREQACARIQPTINAKKVNILIIVGLLTEVLCAGFLFYNRTEISKDMLVGVDVTAHRGGALRAPENTLSALAYAIEESADYAEIDVQETKDGVVVLLHDNSLKRTTGINKKIWDMTYHEVEQLDAGAYFSDAYAGEKIPTLQEAIDYCDGKVNLNIEVKYNGENKYLVDKVVRIMERNHIEKTSILSSMNYSFLEKAKKMNPEIQTSYVMHMTYGGIDNLKYADDYSVKSTYINEDLVREAHAMGKEIHAWTINTQWGMERMRYYGVDNLITDNPAMARETYGKEKTGFFQLLKYVM